jgi:hypothetical protein
MNFLPAMYGKKIGIKSSYGGEDPVVYDGRVKDLTQTYRPPKKKDKVDPSKRRNRFGSAGKGRQLQVG